MAARAHRCEWIGGRLRRCGELIVSRRLQARPQVPSFSARSSKFFATISNEPVGFVSPVPGAYLVHTGLVFGAPCIRESEPVERIAHGFEYSLRLAGDAISPVPRFRTRRICNAFTAGR